LLLGNASFERFAPASEDQHPALQHFLHPIAPADGHPHAMQVRHAAWGFCSEDERAQ
jgi:hypothetical protein